MIIQSVVNLVSICAEHGIEHAILSPGSRCAPLTLAFVRHTKIHTRTISDERSAAFIALGMAQQLEKPVVLVCTSGSAALNYFPAVAEAYFQQIPLLILTADRPPEWIDQYDGQTIFQENVYRKHVKASFSLPSTNPSDQSLWHADRITNDAINLSQAFPQGPVHINVPLKEPFYPEENEDYRFPEVKLIKVAKSKTSLSPDTKKKLALTLSGFQRIVLVCGQGKPDRKVSSLLDQLAKTKKLMVLTDTISNMQSEETISLHDHWLGQKEFSDPLQPDLILSFGNSIISKSLKLFLRATKAEHWHIQSDGQAKDTFLKLTRIVSSDVDEFLEWLLGSLPENDQVFFDSWKKLENQTRNQLPQVLQESEFGEYPAFHQILSRIPPFSKIHVANSMAVRYLNFLGKRSQEIICNRGTSGIDGSNSTAVGCTFTTKEPITLITGDLAFFYDRNAFWHNYSMPNLRIVLLNNHAGGIFRLIDGPAKQPELEEYFETKQRLTAASISQEFGFEYQQVESREALELALNGFYSPSSKPKLIEVSTDSEMNARILSEVKAKIKALLSESFYS
ncbi:2-succinyl-5-enolpyruvyl-6-hydroxy-3-cyclohexene-1-carboxylic-acid synthase [Algoriphagus namhaensis]|uniref:2-succinyl-5-enolpyruvyl-6-hydroxy-3-cyclohexene-1-carboxylate synthase n=1 Tax=Algoriphagus namhaensis TaxID=915353 RepID=A0ABV8AUP4_9BACT